MSEIETGRTVKASSGQVHDVRKNEGIKEALRHLEETIGNAIAKINAPLQITGFDSYTPSIVVQALSDSELLTFELWVKKENEKEYELISGEVKRRREQYEEFTRRFGEQSKS